MWREGSFATKYKERLDLLIKITLKKPTREVTVKCVYKTCEQTERQNRQLIKFSKCGKVKIFVNSSNKSKLYSRRN